LIDFGELGFVGALVGLEPFHEGAAFDAFFADLFLVAAQLVEFVDAIGDGGDGLLEFGLAGLVGLELLGVVAEVVEAGGEFGGGAIDVAMQLLLALEEGRGLHLGVFVVFELGAGLFELGESGFNFGFAAEGLGEVGLLGFEAGELELGALVGLLEGVESIGLAVLLFGALGLDLLEGLVAVVEGFFLALEGLPLGVAREDVGFLGK
jgi:hypothetical protein